MIVSDLILITNDDGISAPGIVALEQRLAQAGIAYAVSAPLHEKSGCGHSITLHDPLRARKLADHRFAIHGTPADAVILYFDAPLDKRPDLILSGINLGGNLAHDITYSGTVCAAIEGFYHGVTSIAVSLYFADKNEYDRSHFDTAAELFVGRILPFMEKAFGGHSLYETPHLFNVNIPVGALSKKRPAIRWTSLGRRNYGGQIVKREDPRGRPYYWIGGDQLGFEDIPGSDCNAMRDGAVSITPLTVHFTDEKTLEHPEGDPMEIFAQLIDIFLHLDVHLAEIMTQYQTWTYLILFLVIFCETGLVVTPFLPGDSLLFAAGALSATQGSPLTPEKLFLLLVIAAVCGDNTNYWIGRFLGPKVFSREESRILNKKHLLRTQAFYEKHGGKTIILARFMPIIRTFAPFVAGIGKMRYTRFLSFSVIGGTSWMATFIFAGFYFGNIPVVKKNFTLVIMAIIVISLLPAFFEFVKAIRSKDHAAG